MPASFSRCSAVEVVVGDEIAADLRAAGHDLAGVVIHVLVRQRHAVQRDRGSALCQRRIGVIGRLQRRFGLDRHEGVEAAAAIARSDAGRTCVTSCEENLLRPRSPCATAVSDIRAGSVLISTPSRVCASRKVAGSRSNGSVPAIGAKPSNAGPIELAMRVGDLGAHGNAGDIGHRLDFLGVGLVMRVAPFRRAAMT